MIRTLRSACAASLAVVAVAVWASSAKAAAFEPAHVAKDATWVLHVDTETLFQSNLWEIVQENMDPTEHLRMQAGLELLHDFTGVNLMTDLHDVTLYGHGFQPGSAVVLLHGSWEPATLTGVLQNARDYGVFEHGQHQVHRWTDDRDHKTKYGSFFGGDLIVISESQDAVNGALDVLDDQPNRAMTPTTGPARPPTDAGLLAFVSAQGIDALRESGQARSPILSRIRAGWISVNESSTQLTLHADIESNSPQMARQLMNGLNGLKSFAQVAIGDDAKPSQKTGVALLDDAKAQAQGDHVVIDWPISLEAVSNIAHEIAEERTGHATQPTTVPTTQP